jgi:hypothetical protein
METEMKFYEIIDNLIEGQSFRRKSWENKGVFIAIRDEKLKIYNPEDKTVRDLIVSTGDLMGEDWVSVA